MTAEEVRRRVEETVLRAVVAGPLWSPGEAVVVAVSGGPDSLCLLHVLHALRQRHGGHLHVAHLDHRLRGAVSAAEAARVAALARAWDLPVTLGEADVAALAEREHLSAEEAARRARYRFLARVAVDVDAPAIALGHTADDQVETVLMHIVRGSGLHGLAGMRPVAPPPPWVTEGLAGRRPLRLVRPLLEVTRAETEGYCAACGLVPAEDSWNQDPRFLRVRLRREVIPLLESINPRFREAALRLARLAAWQEEDLQAMLDAHWPSVAREQGGMVRLNLAAWARLPWTLRLLALRRAVAELRGHLEGLTWEAVVAAGRLDGADVGHEVALVEEFLARREYETLAIGPRVALQAPGAWPDLGPAWMPIAVPGRTALPGGYALVAELQSPGAAPWSEAGRWEAWLDAGRCGRRLWLRQRRPGDRFQPLGMGGQKKLQDFFVDEKVPRAERSRVPLVVSPRGIVWVVGYRLDERFRVRPGTDRLLHLRWEPPSA